MKKYNLYGEVNFSPISMSSNNLSAILSNIERLKKEFSNFFVWYSVYKVYKYKSEELIQSEMIPACN